MCKGEGDAFKAGRDNIDSVTTVVREGSPRVVPKRDGGRDR